MRMSKFSMGLAASFVLAAALGVTLSHRGVNTVGTPAAIGHSDRAVNESSLKQTFTIAEVVVRAHVTSVGQAQWTTPDGSAPTVDVLRTSSHQIIPVTPVTFETTRLFKGDVSGTFTLWVPGGHPAVEMNGQRMTSEDQPVPQVGADLVLFLGKPVDWRAGTGAALPGRASLGLCSIDGTTTATCSGSTIPQTTLFNVLAS